jgi:hypothetical protein
VIRPILMLLFMSLRRFSSAQLDQCAAWFDLVETPDESTDLGPIGEGESQSIRVTSNNIFGVAKPGPAKASDLVCRAAHEKIAFDLAHRLDLPIPPVILWGKDMGHYVRGRSISAWAFSRAAKWDEAHRLGLLTPELIASAGSVVSAMRVFHTWISDTDRKSDHTQVDLDSADMLGVAFIDHAFSMSYQWKQPDANVGACPPYMPALEDQGTMLQVAELISQTSDVVIEHIVNRIPASYLPPAERQHILDNLKGRRGKLRTILGL